MTVRILTGDCRDILTSFDPNSIDAIVTDPPYGLEFMGKEWDRPWAVSAERKTGFVGRDELTLPSHRDNRNANCRSCGGRQRGAKRCECDVPDWDRDPRTDMQAFQDWSLTWTRVAFRVLKPGGFLLAFGGTRTFHRMTSAIEDAGFEVKDCISWLYGSGMPKHKTLLKPAWEPVIVAKKRGTGGLQIEACRLEPGLGGSRDGEQSAQRRYTEAGSTDFATKPGPRGGSDLGRWPANVLLDEDAAELLDEQSGDRPSGAWNGQRTKPKHNNIYGTYGTIEEPPHEGSTGGASRFFFVANSEESRHEIIVKSHESVVQYDLNSQATEGEQWAGRDQNRSTLPVSDIPPKRDTNESTFGTLLLDEAAPSLLMSSNGNGITDPSPMATKSTISTSTNKTTTSPTLNSLIPSRTSDCTVDASEPMTADGSSHAEVAENSSGSVSTTGISVPKDGPSTDDAEPVISEKSLPINNSDGPRFCYTSKASRAERTIGGAPSIHPTVKPLSLMTWLVQLVTPAGGVVLDPFAGSGSTLIAASRCGFDAIGIEMDAEYAEIARRRVEGDAPMFADVEVTTVTVDTPRQLGIEVPA